MICSACGASSDNPVKCDYCGVLIEIPPSPDKQNESPDAAERLEEKVDKLERKVEKLTTKNCPYCAEEIQVDAIKCKYCKSSLNEEEQQQTVQEELQQTVIKNTYVRQPPLGFFAAVGTCLRKYFNFSGRARRSEYWYFFLFCIIIDIVAYSDESLMWLLWVIFIPSISVAVRRLHDSNKSGWRLLWWLTGIGIIFVIYWLIIKGDADKNSYG